MNFIKSIKDQRAILSFKEYLIAHKDDIDLLNLKMNELYQYMKDIAPSYADNASYIEHDYGYLVMLLEHIEKMLPCSFILANKPDFTFSKIYNRLTSKDIKEVSTEEILKYIVYRGRSYMAAYFCQNKDETNVDFAHLNLMDYCQTSANNVKLVCDNLNIIADNYIIHPAFYNFINIYGYGNNHSFTIVSIDEKAYIVDLTYSQFFLLRNNNFNRLGIPLLGRCGLGLYMGLTEKRKKFAEELMRDGYTEATKENIKLYFDGFAMSYRNGLYYENMPEVTYETSYTADDYLNFLAGIDNQVNHEELKCLGEQKRILKNPDISFVPKNYLPR